MSPYRLSARPDAAPAAPKRRPLLCRLGLHSWREIVFVDERQNTWRYGDRRCTECGKIDRVGPHEIDGKCDLCGGEHESMGLMEAAYNGQIVTIADDVSAGHSRRR